MTINVGPAIQQLTAFTDAGKKQVTFATRVALTRTAQLASAKLKHEIRDIFRSPTPYTLSSLFVRPATKSNLSAEVKLKDFAAKATPAATYLAPQIKGGTRPMKRFERAMQSVGALPPGYRIVPGKGAKLDSYGNMNRGQIVQILAYFRSFPEAGYKANMTAQGRAKMAMGTKKKPGFRYFVGRPGDRMPLGVYQSMRGGGPGSLKPVMVFVRYASYHKIFDFEYVVEKTVEKEFAGQFARAYVEALRTAR